MASVRLLWTDGSDIHVLKDERSPALFDRLIVEDDSVPPKRESVEIAADIDMTTLTFKPNFFSTTTPPSHAGISVTTATGEVTVPSSLSAPPRLRSFVLEATVKTKPPNPQTLGPIPIRVCIHNAISKLWLTPSPLTVRKGESRGFTVLARFDDLTVGDISRRPGIIWGSADPGKISAVGRSLEAKVASGSVKITANHAGHSATGQVKAEEPWSTPIAATLVPGSAGVKKMAQVPNILFLPDGFTAAEKPKFEALVKAIVTTLHAKNTFPPYGHLKGAANYFMAFVPSPTRGCSLLYERRLKAGAIKDIPDPVKPTSSAAGSFSLANLIYEVGLPTPGDRQMTPTEAFENWDSQFGSRVSTGFTDAVFGKWRELSDHQLANERDTAFGLRNGERPTMDRPLPAHEIGFNPRRTSWTNLRELFKNVRLSTTTGPMIGTIWAEQNESGTVPAPEHPRLPAGVKVGQDSGRVCFLLGGSRSGRALQSLGNTTFTRLVAPPIATSVTSTNQVPFKEVTIQGIKQVALEPPTLPSIPTLDAVAAVAHHLSHAFGLSDEHGTPGSPLTIPATSIDTLADQGNVMAASRLATSATDPRLDPNSLHSIDWREPRIEAAGVLAKVPVPSGSSFRITLRRGHAKAFKAGNLVRLRTRPLQLFSPSRPLTVTNVSGEVVTVEEVDRDPLDPMDLTLWGPADVMLRPVRGKPTSSDPKGPELRLMSEIIRNHLAVSGVPLNRSRPLGGTPIPVCVKDDALKQVPRHLPDGLRTGLRAFKSQIVGLYDGGASFYCGVYHPTGACLMRTPAGPSFGTYILCPVCQYVVVDHVDPTKHAIVDAANKKRHPEP